MSGTNRPFAIVGFTFFLVLFVAISIPFNVAIAFAVLLFAASLISIISGKVRAEGVLPLALFTASMAFGFVCLKNVKDVNPVLSLVGNTAVVEATLVDLPIRQSNVLIYTFETASIKLDKAPQKVKFQVVSVSEFDMVPFDKMKATVRFSALSGYNGNYSFYSKGIYIRGKIVSVNSVIVEKNRPLYYHVLMLRDHILTTISKNMSAPEAALTRGIALGDTSLIDPQVSSDFKTLGVSHVLAISGSNITIVTSFLFVLLLALRVKRRIAAGVCSGAAIFFVALTGFPLSGVRAGIMCMIIYVGIAIFKNADPLNSLGFSALIILIYNPFAAAEVGFILSFLATLGLIVLAMPLSIWLLKKIPKNKIVAFALKPIYISFALTVSAVAFTLPVTFYVFGYLSTISPISNLLITPVTSLSIAATSFGMITSGVGFISKFFFLMAELLAKYMIYIARVLASIPYASISVDFVFVGLFISATLLLFAFAFLGIVKGKIQNSAKAVRMTAILSVIILLTSIFSYSVMDNGVTKITMLDSGNGACIAVTRRDYLVLIGTGGVLAETKVKSLLMKKQIRNFEMIILPSDSSEYCSGAMKILKYKKPSNLFMTDSGEKYNEINSLGLKATKLLPLADSTITVWNDIKIKIMQNNKSFVIMITIGQTKILVADGQNNLYIIDEKFKTPDLAIFAGGFPESIAQINAKNTIAACSAEKSLDLSDFAFVTAGQGDIVAETRGNRDLILRREN